MLEGYNEYKEINLPWLHSIPSHWNILRNKNVMLEQKEIVGSNSHKHTLLSLTLKGIIERDLENAKGKFPKEFDSYKIVKTGNIVFCLFDIDETPRTVGLAMQNGMLTGAYDVFEPNNSKINGYYLYYYYLSLDNIKALKPLYTGLRKVINISSFNSLKLPIPPRPEQDQIVRYLDWKVSMINKYINAKKKQIDLLREQKQAVINRTIMQGGEGWDYKPLKYWAKSNLFSLSSNTDSNYRLEYLDISSIGHGFVKKTPIHYTFENAPSRARRIVHYGDTIISTVRTYLRSVCFISHDIENCIVSTGFSVLTPNKNIVLPELLSFVLSTNHFINETISNSIGVSYPAINDNKLMSLKVALPRSLEKQELLYSFIKKQFQVFDDVIQSIQKQVYFLHEYRTRLISDVVTGKVNVQNVKVPEFEAENENISGVGQEMGENTISDE